MHIGYFSVNTPTCLSPDVLAAELESRGYESLWFGEHPHLPAQEVSYPGGGDVPSEYRRMMDPLVSMTLAAAKSTALRLGTSVTLPLEHDVFDLAKSVATLDHISSGRLFLGVGVGWNHLELTNCRPIAWRDRYRALEECVAALRRLWTHDTPEFDGTFYSFHPVWSNPKPLQQPYPPILSGMAGSTGVTHTLRWADGWMPLDVALGDVEKKVGEFREAARASPKAVPITLAVWGNPSLDRLMRYSDLGIDRAIIGFSRRGIEDPSTTLAFLDRYAELVERV